MKKEKKPSVLLHSCCGPCSSSVMEKLCEDFEITVFFYNPNITDGSEYEKRKAAQLLCIEKFNESIAADVDQAEKAKVDFIEGKYEPQAFCEASAGLEDEPEGGKRCTECFRLRLERTAQIAKRDGFDCFATTLTVSPHKNYQLIKEIGEKTAEKHDVEFLDRDFKKKDGFKRSIELSREYGLYRQNYCGCDFAKNLTECIRNEGEKNVKTDYSKGL